MSLESLQDVERARAAMKRCDIDSLADRRFHQLSGGEKRRTLLAQALCQEAEIVLLDEPTAALDPAHASAFFETLRLECERGLSAITVTHDLNLAVRFASRLLVLDALRVAADTAPDTLLQSDVLERAFSVPLHKGSLPGSGRRFVVPS
jgi:iron complex transport system ATP-binding protein